jgi:hypothetical protein
MVRELEPTATPAAPQDATARALDQQQRDGECVNPDNAWLLEVVDDPHIPAIARSLINPIEQNSDFVDAFKTHQPHLYTNQLTTYRSFRGFAWDDREKLPGYAFDSGCITGVLEAIWARWGSASTYPQTDVSVYQSYADAGLRTLRKIITESPQKIPSWLPLGQNLYDLGKLDQEQNTGEIFAFGYHIPSLVLQSMNSGAVATSEALGLTAATIATLDVAFRRFLVKRNLQRDSSTAKWFAFYVFSSLHGLFSNNNQREVVMRILAQKVAGAEEANQTTPPMVKRIGVPEKAVVPAARRVTAKTHARPISAEELFIKHAGRLIEAYKARGSDLGGYRVFPETNLPVNVRTYQALGRERIHDSWEDVITNLNQAYAEIRSGIETYQQLNIAERGSRTDLRRRIQELSASMGSQKSLVSDNVSDEIVRAMTSALYDVEGAAIADRLRRSYEFEKQEPSPEAMSIIEIDRTRRDVLRVDTTIRIIREKLSSEANHVRQETLQRWLETLIHRQEELQSGEGTPYVSDARTLDVLNTFRRRMLQASILIEETIAQLKTLRQNVHSLKATGMDQGAITSALRAISEQEIKCADILSSKKAAAPGVIISTRALVRELGYIFDVYDRFSGQRQEVQMTFSGQGTGQFPMANFEVIRLEDGAVFPLRSHDAKFEIVPGKESLVFNRDGSDLVLNEDGAPSIYRDRSIVYIDPKTKREIPVEPVEIELIVQGSKQ